MAHYEFSYQLKKIMNNNLKIYYFPCYFINLEFSCFKINQEIHHIQSKQSMLEAKLHYFLQKFTYCNNHLNKHLFQLVNFQRRLFFENFFYRDSFMLYLFCMLMNFYQFLMNLCWLYAYSDFYFFIYFLQYYFFYL